MVTTSKEPFRIEVYGKLAEYRVVRVEPVGFRYREYREAETDPTGSSSSSVQSDSETDDSQTELIEDDIHFLRSLDPKEWKKQDHYAVLGLKNLRITASGELLKKAYRKKVLLHHPDKRKSRGEKVEDADNDYFTCITKAYEILGNVSKRCSYDSIDPDFDDHVPPVNAYSKENFYQVFAPVFKDNARWSGRPKVPELGHENSTFEEVDRFYSAWYDFDSWREFSYLDEEEKEKGESRDERRWIEKQNKAARLKRKKEEMVRIRQLVDNAYACDPRVQRFKEMERTKKLAYKKSKQDAARAKVEEEEKKRLAVVEMDRKAKEKEEAEMRIQAEAAKKAKESLKKSLKKERKTLRGVCKSFNNFGTGETQIIHNMAELDKLCELLSLESISKLNKSLENCDFSNGGEIFLKEVKEMNDKLDKEKEELFNSCIKSTTNTNNRSNSVQWSSDDAQLLIKAVNLFPAGTNQRWDVVANYINQHSTNSSCPKRTAKDVLTKAKEMQKSDYAAKEDVGKQAYQQFEKSQKVSANNDEAAPTQRFDSPAEMQGLNPSPWSAEEQKLLEQALKTYNASSTPNRWESIAQCIPGRSKKDCMIRYKELVEMVKAKKAAQASVAPKKA